MGHVLSPARPVPRHRLIDWKGLNEERTASLARQQSDETEEEEGLSVGCRASEEEGGSALERMLGFSLRSFARGAGATSKSEHAAAHPHAHGTNGDRAAELPTEPAVEPAAELATGQQAAEVDIEHAAAPSRQPSQFSQPACTQHRTPSMRPRGRSGGSRRKMLLPERNELSPSSSPSPSPSSSPASSSCARGNDPSGGAFTHEVTPPRSRESLVTRLTRLLTCWAY